MVNPMAVDGTTCMQGIRADVWFACDKLWQVPRVLTELSQFSSLCNARKAKQGEHACCLAVVCLLLNMLPGHELMIMIVPLSQLNG